MLNFVFSLIVVFGFIAIVIAFPIVQNVIVFGLMLVLTLIVAIAGYNFIVMRRQKAELTRKYPTNGELNLAFQRQLNSKKPKRWLNKNVK